jgi:hypothetical protein
MYKIYLTLYIILFERGVIMANLVKLDTKASVNGLLVSIDDNGDMVVAGKDESETVNVIKIIKMFLNHEIKLSISKSEKGDFDEEKQ